MILLPAPGPPPRFDAQMDPRIVVHPPQSSLGVQPPGSLVAQNLYPGLQLLPIEQSRATAEPIPAIWPHLKIKQIPIIWPKGVIKPVQGSVNAQLAGK
jgi:hypothetical protein